MTLIKVRLFGRYMGIYYYFAVSVLGFGATLTKQEGCKRLDLHNEWSGVMRQHYL